MPKQLLIESPQRFRVDYSGRHTYLEGLALLGNQRNKNGRLYRESTLDHAVSEINEKVKGGNLFAEMGHPATPTVDPSRICGVVRTLDKVGPNYHARVKVIDEGCGKILKSVLEAGGTLGLSSRSLGSVKRDGNIDIVQDDLKILAIDVVESPSSGHFVKALHETLESGVLNVGEVKLAQALIQESWNCDGTEYYNKLYAGHEGFPSLNDHPDADASWKDRMDQDNYKLFQAYLRLLGRDQPTKNDLEAFKAMMANPTTRVSLKKEAKLNQAGDLLRENAKRQLSRISRANKGFR